MATETLTQTNTIAREHAIDAMLDYLGDGAHGARVIRDAESTTMAYIVTDLAFYTLQIYTRTRGLVNVTRASFVGGYDHLTLDI